MKEIVYIAGVHATLVTAAVVIASLIEGDSSAVWLLLGLAPSAFFAMVLCGVLIGLPVQFATSKLLPRHVLSYVATGSTAGLLPIWLLLSASLLESNVLPIGAAIGALSGYLWWKWVIEPEVERK